MENTKSLFELTAEWAAIEDMLYESGGEMTPELEAAFNSNKEKLPAKVDNYVYLIDRKKARSAFLADQIKRLQAAKKVEDNSFNRIKEHILFVMKSNKYTKLEGNKSTISLRNTQSLEVSSDYTTMAQDTVFKVLEDAGFDTSLFNIKVEPNKTAIKDRIKETGIWPDGVGFVDNQSLSIR